MTRLLFALGMALALAAPAQAQTGSLSGTIIDESGAVIPGATVTLAGPTHASTVSGSRGEYSFKNLPEGNYQLTATLVGFSQATLGNVAVGRSPVEVPPIKLTIAKLSDIVVVSASKSDTALVDAPVTMSVLTSEALKATPALNYGDLLRGVPGVN